MKGIRKKLVVAGLAIAALAAFQVARAGTGDAHGSTVGKIAYVTQGVVERVVDLVHWASDQVWGTPDARAADATEAEGQTGDFRWEGRIDPGLAVEVQGVNGDIRADLADGADVVVTAEKRARRSDPDDVRIEVVEHDGGVTICAVYPGPENRCAPGRSGQNKVRENDVQVTFRVSVPQGVELRGRTVNGDVQARDLESDVDAATVNGGLEVSTSGWVRASTVNGSIRAVMAGRDWEGPLELETVNGSISLDVPDDLDARIRASWVNGGLDTDLPFTVEGRVSRRRAEGLLGQGGPPIELSTVNGSIRIR